MKCGRSERSLLWLVRSTFAQSEPLDWTLPLPPWLVVCLSAMHNHANIFHWIKQMWRAWFSFIKTAIAYIASVQWVIFLCSNWFGHASNHHRRISIQRVGCKNLNIGNLSGVHHALGCTNALQIFSRIIIIKALSQLRWGLAAWILFLHSDLCKVKSSDRLHFYRMLFS